MATVHIGADRKDIAETVLMPGDPLRAKMIAENFLEDAYCYNEIRGTLGFTGTYKGKRVSVQASGMGMPSIGIYAHELFTRFDVENIIRIGSCGAFQPELGLMDVVIAAAASTDSNWAYHYRVPGIIAPTANVDLVFAAKAAADEKKIPVTVGNILCSDVFYYDDPEIWKQWARMGVLGVEMESAALYLIAARQKKRALTILTVSDSFVKDEKLTASQRQNSLKNMIEIGLETALRI